MNRENAGLEWSPLVEDLPRQHGFEPLAVEGRVPEDLSGTLFRAGPGLFSSFGRRYGHLFDGDGAVSAVKFAGGRAFSASRVVESAGLVAERKAGKPLYFCFGTTRPGFPRSFKPKNAANTSVLCWNERTFALFEGGLPTELRCEEDLLTVGETNLGGALRGTFSAHPHYSPARKALYNFGLRFRPWGSYVDLYELKDSGAARRLASWPMPGAVFLHDFIVTEKHAVFFNSPLRVRWLDLFRQRSLAESLLWKPELGVSVVVVPLDDPGKPLRFETDAFMQFHFANAFERGGEIVVDFVRYPDLDRAQRLPTELMRRAPLTDPSSRLCRAVIDVARRKLTCEERWPRNCEFPVVAASRLTAEQRFVYLVAQAAGSAPETFATRLAKVDASSGRSTEFAFPAGCYPSEAVFVPRLGASAEDDGYLLTFVFDASRGATFAAALDARDLDRGVLAKAWFDHSVPITFHGAWRPAAPARAS